MLKEYHAGALDQAEARELVGGMFLVGPGQQFDSELDTAAGGGTVAPGDPFEGVESRSEEQGVESRSEEHKPNVVAGALVVALEAEKAGPTKSNQAKVETTVVVAKVVD